MLKELLKLYPINYCLRLLAQLFVPSISIKDNLGSLRDIPIFFIHGSKDLMVPIDSVFEKIWNSVSVTKKIALITPYKHSSSFYDKKFYKFMCDYFINSTDINHFFIELEQKLNTIE